MVDRRRSLLVLVATATVLAAPQLAGTSHAAVCSGADTLPNAANPGLAAHATACLINKRRRHHHEVGLSRNRALQRSAQRHTNYMNAHNCFAHQCPGEADLYHRLRRAGYLKPGLRRWEYGEVIAWGLTTAATPRAIVKAWMHSPEHRAEILHRRFRDFGIGVVWGTPTVVPGVGGIYTVDFGYRRR
jgi:uncharacterized protein YkwD